MPSNKNNTAAPEFDLAAAEAALAEAEAAAKAQRDLINQARAAQAAKERAERLDTVTADVDAVHAALHADGGVTSEALAEIVAGLFKAYGTARDAAKAENIKTGTGNGRGNGSQSKPEGSPYPAGWAREILARMASGTMPSQFVSMDGDTMVISQSQAAAYVKATNTERYGTTYNVSSGAMHDALQRLTNSDYGVESKLAGVTVFSANVRALDLWTEPGTTVVTTAGEKVTNEG